MFQKNIGRTSQEVVAAAAAYLLVQSDRLSEITIYEKSAFNLVSEVDITCEKILVQGLQKLIPNAGFITEENTIGHINSEYTWIIDPLDGTTNFLHGLPLFCISVGLMYKNQIILGIIHQVKHQEVFYAYKGGGSFLNGKRLPLLQPKMLKNSLIVNGFFYNDIDVLEKYLNITKQIILKSRGFRRLGSAAIDLAYVAAGRCDGFFEYNLNSWDVAAGIIIVQEAGGLVSDFSNTQTQLFGKQILATCPLLNIELLNIIACA